MGLMVYNTKSGKKEKFEPLDDRKVKMYVCGPTVYDVPHIGHGRSYVFFDVVRRYLEFVGYEVTMVMNFTDTEESITKRARELRKDPMKLADDMIHVFLKEMDQLGIKRASYYPRVTEHIKEIIEMAKSLIEMGYAYVVDGDVFFDVRKAGGYGVLIDRPVDELVAGNSREPSSAQTAAKRSPNDFALWRKEKLGEPSWESPWGRGRPGWHIECSVMATKYLGSAIDIQGGGTDLIFPHHESSSLISQTRFGRPFAKYYLHNGFVTVNQQKMSKSKSNFVTLREVLRKYDYQVVRFFLLKRNYREPLEYGDQQMAEAESCLRRIQTALNKTIKTPTVVSGNACLEAERSLIDRLVEARREFIEAMDGDFDTEKAIRILLKASEHIEEFANSCKRFTSKETGEQAKAICKQFNDVMGVCAKL